MFGAGPLLVSMGILTTERPSWGWLAGRVEEPRKASLVPYLHIQVSPGGGRRVGVGADGRAGVDVIRAEVVYGVADATADGAAVIPAAKTKTP